MKNQEDRDLIVEFLKVITRFPILKIAFVQLG